MKTQTLLSSTSVTYAYFGIESTFKGYYLESGQF